MEKSMIKVDLNERSCSSHLFRHASEITKETKGGYLVSFIYIKTWVFFPSFLASTFIKQNPIFKKISFIQPIKLDFFILFKKWSFFVSVFYKNRYFQSPIEEKEENF